MMNIQAKPAAGANAGVPPNFAANPTSAAGGAVFSQFMADAAQGTGPKAQTPPTHGQPNAADSDAAQTQRSTDKARASARDAARNAARSADSAPSTAKATPKGGAAPVIEAPEKNGTADGTAKSAADADAAALATPELSAWAAALTRTLPPDAANGATPASAEARADGPALGDAGATRKSHDPARAQARLHPANGAPGSRSGSGNDAPIDNDVRRSTEPVTAADPMNAIAEAAITASNSAAAISAVAGLQNSEAKALERVALPASSGDVSALVGSQAAQAGAASTALPETLTVQVATPTDAPEFREALGVQVSLLARDGVQSAELHLNPAEMGPISVHIVMDGAQARVDFGADSANTRELIESGLPELAAALRDAGFTLAGGGVSQHSAGSQGGSAQSSGNAPGAAAHAARHTADDAARDRFAPGNTRMRVPNSAVDLYA